MELSCVVDYDTGEIILEDRPLGECRTWAIENDFQIVEIYNNDVWVRPQTGVSRR